MIERVKTWLMTHRRWTIVSPGLLTFAVFAGTLSCQFVFDDIPQVLENPFITNAGYWRRIFMGSVWSFRGAGEHDNFYRPLQFAVYWLLYRVNGPNPAVFHLFQLVLCAATACLVYLLGREFFHNDLAALGGALLWTLHPQHVETIAWISALPDAGAAFFELLGFLLFLRAEKFTDYRRIRYSFAALAYLPALFFKESALAFPLLVAAYWFFLSRDTSSKQNTLNHLSPRPFGGAGLGVRGFRRVNQFIASFAPFTAAAAIYLALRIAVLGRFSQAPQGLDLSKHAFVAAFALLGQHAKLFFWPVHLSAFRVFDLQTSLHSAWPWLALLLLVAAILFRRREPVLGFLIVWWVVALAPCLSVGVVSFPVADRFAYLPSVGLALGSAYLLLVKLPRVIVVKRLAPVLAGIVLIASFVYMVQDVRLVPTWGNNVALWSYSLHASPDAALVHLFQATLLRNRDGNMQGAEREYQTVLRLNRAAVRPLAGVAYESYLGLGQIQLLRGDTAGAIKYYQAAIQTAPSHAPAYKAMGALYFPQGNYQEAAKYFTTAVKIDPQDVEARFFLGTCALKLGHSREAAEQFRAARQVDPSYVEAYTAEARALDAAGEAAEAARVRSLAVKR